jgi:pilus assembly protein Flp/PilA
MLKRIRETFALLRASRHGATAIEYGLIVSLVALGAMGGIQAFGGGLGNMWNYIATEVMRAS